MRLAGQRKGGAGLDDSTQPVTPTCFDCEIDGLVGDKVRPRTRSSPGPSRAAAPAPRACACARRSPPTRPPPSALRKNGMGATGSAPRAANAARSSVGPSIRRAVRHRGSPCHQTRRQRRPSPAVTLPVQAHRALRCCSRRGTARRQPPSRHPRSRAPVPALAFSHSSALCQYGYSVSQSSDASVSRRIFRSSVRPPAERAARALPYRRRPWQRLPRRCVDSVRALRPRTA
jgi:hypothetical protein